MENKMKWRRALINGRAVRMGKGEGNEGITRQ